ncbi:MAG TPA: ATP-binding protein [Mycobacteriales bacterium]
MSRLRRPSVVARALVQHAAISLVALVAVGALAAIICVQVVQDQALRRAEQNGASLARRVVAPMVTPAVEEGDTDALVALNTQVRYRMAGDMIQRIKVWSPNGLILYCDDPRQVGLTFPLDEDDLDALTSGGVDSDISDLDKSENVYDRGFGESLEVYAGVRDTSGNPILVETYFAANRLHADETALIRRIVPVVLAAVIVLGLLLVPLAFTLARRVSRYERERQSMIRLAVEASSAERRRVAGELHDGVIQDLAGVGYALSSIDSQLVTLGRANGERTAGERTTGERTASERATGERAAGERAAGERAAGDAELAPVEGMLTTLHTAQRLVHDDLLALRELTGLQYAADSPAVDPEAALRVVADHVAAEGTPVEMVVGPLPGLPPAHRAALIRIGREAMRNAAKHAPGSHVVLTLGVSGGNVVLTVVDDGPGFDPHNAVGPVEGHIGLALLADAAEGAGGRLDVRSRPSHGTTIRATIPLLNS